MDLAAGRPREKLAQADQVAVGVFVHPFAADDDVLAEVAEVRDRATKGGQSQAREDAGRRGQIHFVREGECWLIDSYKPAKDWHHGAGR